MRFLRPLLPALPLLVSFGCSESHERVRSTSSALTDAEATTVSLRPNASRVVPGTRVDVTIEVDVPGHYVSYGGSSESDHGGCAGYSSSDDDESGYWTSPSASEVVTIDGLACSPDCTVTSTGAFAFAVLSQSIGKKTVTASYTKTDGTTGSASAVVDYETPTAILAARDERSPSGSTFAMVPNDVQTWRIGVGSDAGPLDVPPCEIEVTATGAIEALGRGGCDTFSFRAVRGGTGPVRMRYPGVERTETITVVDGSSVARAELWRLSLGAADVASAGSFLGPHEDPLTLRYRCAAEERVALRLTAIDGTIAYGGALVATNPAAVQVITEQQTSTLNIEEPSDGTVTVAIPGATLPPLPYVVRTGCPSLDGDAGVDAGDAGADR
jgi:hypothetical protein